MDDVKDVKVLHSVEDLVDHLAGLVLRQRLGGYHSEQLPASCPRGKRNKPLEISKLHTISTVD